jgi:hypothetical protein
MELRTTDCRTVTVTAYSRNAERGYKQTNTLTTWVTILKVLTLWMWHRTVYRWFGGKTRLHLHCPRLNRTSKTKLASNKHIYIFCLYLNVSLLDLHSDNKDGRSIYFGNEGELLLGYMASRHCRRIFHTNRLVNLMYKGAQSNWHPSKYFKL